MSEQGLELGNIKSRAGLSNGMLIRKVEDWKKRRTLSPHVANGSRNVNNNNNNNSCNNYNKEHTDSD